MKGSKDVNGNSDVRNRSEAIRAKRRADPSISDETPTLLDIERTHVLIL